MTQQLTLPLASVVPFPIAVHKVRRAVRRSLRRAGNLLEPGQALQVWGYLEQQSLLEQIRQRARCRARNITGRNSAQGQAVYAASPEGRRVARLVQRLSEEIAEQEKKL